MTILIRRGNINLALNDSATEYARVVELADSLDSGSSVHYARAGSSPASRTKKKDMTYGHVFLFLLPGGELGVRLHNEGLMFTIGIIIEARARLFEKS